MRIAMVIKQLHYSGAAKIFMWLATALANAGHEIIVFTYLPDDIKRPYNPNIQWIRMDMRHSGFYAKYKAYRRIIKKYHPACSISFLLDANVLNILACLKQETKSIVCERNDPYKPHYYKLKVLKHLFRWADGAVFQLSKAKEYYSMIKALTAVIPNPVSRNTSITLKPFAERENIIVSLGRMDIFQKRQDVMLRAFDKFRTIYSNFRLIIYGDGDDKSRIENLITELNLQDHVTLAGVIDKPIEAMSNAKFFIMTSDFEGIPNSLVEAMSIGLPCISTDCSPGGAALLIKDNINGLLVHRNDPDALFMKMIYLVENYEIADKLGNNAKMINERFSEKRIISQWTDYITKTTLPCQIF